MAFTLLRYAQLSSDVFCKGTDMDMDRKDKYLPSVPTHYKLEDGGNRRMHHSGGVMRWAQVLEAVQNMLCIFKNISDLKA